MPLSHECSGDRHYQSGSRFAKEDRRRRENAGSGPLRGGSRRLMAPRGAIEKSNWTQGTAFPPESVAHPLRMRPCRDTGNRTMGVPSARYQGYRAAKPIPFGRKGRKASELRGISVSCVAIRAARDRPIASCFAHDNFRYRASNCQYRLFAGSARHERRAPISATDARQTVGPWKFFGIFRFRPLHAGRIPDPPPAPDFTLDNIFGVARRNAASAPIPDARIAV